VDPAASADVEAKAAPAPDAATAATLRDVVRDSAEYAHALGQLVASEAELAKVNLVRILIVALLVPAIAAGAVLSLDAFFAALLFDWMQDWSLAIGTVALANLALLAGSLWVLRSWWRTLSLPRSRAAFAGLWERP
jgi:uncharacterized membrane protein YqjE